MTKETTSFVYVTYILSTPERVFEAITNTERATQLIRLLRHLAVRARGQKRQPFTAQLDRPRDVEGLGHAPAFAAGEHARAARIEHE